MDIDALFHLSSLQTDATSKVSHKHCAAPWGEGLCCLWGDKLWLSTGLGPKRLEIKYTPPERLVDEQDTDLLSMQRIAGLGHLCPREWSTRAFQFGAGRFSPSPLKYLYYFQLLLNPLEIGQGSLRGSCSSTPASQACGPPTAMERRTVLASYVLVVATIRRLNIPPHFSV